MLICSIHCHRNKLHRRCGLFCHSAGTNA
jgi:hypothetical protein